jgi:hypothetical protein
MPEWKTFSLYQKSCLILIAGPIFILSLVMERFGDWCSDRAHLVDKFAWRLRDKIAKDNKNEM